jgi:hypothetical protein
MDGAVNSDGTPATPLGWQGAGPDFEVSGHGPFEWEAYDEDMLIGKGRARTQLGLMLALWRFKRRFDRG